jgi:transcriptional regulator with XRE-family HTH domain
MGERLRRARFAAGLRQRAAARVLGIDRQDLGRYERDLVEPSLDRLREMCLLYGVSADTLLGLSECANPDCRRTVETSQARKHCVSAAA